MKPPLLAVSNLVLARHGQPISPPLNFELKAGEAIHLVGANGSGKTTLLDTLSTLTVAEKGTVSWQGQSAATLGDAVRAQFHYCGHVDALKREWTLLENLQWQGRLIGQRLSSKTLETGLKQMAIRPLKHVPVGQFSKGQQRRAALMRLDLFPRPIWLLDEPFSALDTQGAQALVDWIDRHLATGGAVIFTTHQGYPALQNEPIRFELATAQG